MREPKIAVAGNQWFTKYLIEKMIAKGIKPSLIINMSPEKSDDISGYLDFAPLAGAFDIAIYRPAVFSLKSNEDMINLREHRIDCLFVFGWQRLIPEWLINSCELGVFGVHGGPEKPPRCRGRAVFNWALILGYNRFYMYLFRITPEIDAGDILCMQQFDILPEDDIVSLYHKNCVVSTRMILDSIPKIADGSIGMIPQSELGPSYMPKRTPENGGIHWRDHASKIINLVRALSFPYPGAFTFLRDVKVIINRLHHFDNHIYYEGVPGEILEVFPNGHFVVMSGNGPLYVREYHVDEPLSIIQGDRFQLESGIRLEDPVV